MADAVREYQRLDSWLWCARFLKTRAACAKLVAKGRFRINRLPTDKPHAKLHIGDVLTFPWQDDVLVLRVLALSEHRLSPPLAKTLYEDASTP